MPASSYAAWPIDSLNVRSGSATTSEESVERFGMSNTVFGKVGVTVEIALIRTARRPSWRARASSRTRCW